MSRKMFVLLGAAGLLLLAGHLLFAAQGKTNSQENTPAKIVISANAGTITRQGAVLNLRVNGDVHLTSSSSNIHTAVLTCQDMAAGGTTVENTALDAEEGVHLSVPMSKEDANGVEKQYMLTVDAYEMTRPGVGGNITLTGHQGVQPHLTITPSDRQDKESFDIKADTLIFNTEADKAAQKDGLVAAQLAKKTDASRLTNAQLAMAIAQAVKAREAHLCVLARGAAVINAILFDKSAGAKDAPYQKLSGKADLISGEFSARSGSDAADAATPKVLSALLFHLRGSDAAPCQIAIYAGDPQTKGYRSEADTLIVSLSLDFYPEAQNDTRVLWGGKWTAKNSVNSPLPASFSENILHADGVIDFSTRQSFAAKQTAGKPHGMTIDFSGAKQWIGHNGRMLELNLLAANSVERLDDTQFLWLRGVAGKSWLKVIDLNDAQHPKTMMSTTLNMLADVDAGTMSAVEGDPRVSQGGLQ